MLGHMHEQAIILSQQINAHIMIRVNNKVSVTCRMHLLVIRTSLFIPLQSTATIRTGQNHAAQCNGSCSSVVGKVDNYDLDLKNRKNQGKTKNMDKMNSNKV